MNAQRQRGARRRILLVEDDADIAQLLRVALAKVLPDVDTHHVDNGRDAFAVATSGEAFDLAICDIMLPGLDGARLLRLWAANPASTNMPVVILSGLDPDRLTDVKALPNVIGHHQKPVELLPFARHVKKVLADVVGR